jgi:hypothetical protein
MPLTPTLTPPHILLLSDSDKLARVIEFTLEAHGQFETHLLEQLNGWPMDTNPWDLLLIAFSKLADTPLDILCPTSLLQWVGRRPMLIIAPCPCTYPMREHVWYLEFPFEAQTLITHVAEILSAAVNP